ncbi:hypothetical protein, partial [Paraburkholderia sp. C35]|uniref:hypothetical protein n=1 Tax=Paraburkholderia sp. C35 TaxID=2126993 RepID=UPI001951C5FC
MGFARLGGFVVVAVVVLLRERADLFLGRPFFSLASAVWYRYFTRRPCAGQHLLFFAAAKKSRQKKAAE